MYDINDENFTGCIKLTDYLNITPPPPKCPYPASLQIFTHCLIVGNTFYIRFTYCVNFTDSIKYSFEDYISSLNMFEINIYQL